MTLIKKNLFEKQIGNSETKDLISEDLAILNKKIAALSKLIEDQPSDSQDVIKEDYEYTQEYLKPEPKELFFSEPPENIDADLVLIKDEISNQFSHEQMDGVQFNAIECRARSCLVDLDLESADMVSIVQDTLATHIGRSHLYNIDLDENGRFTMYFSVDE